MSSLATASTRGRSTPRTMSLRTKVVGLRLATIGLALLLWQLLCDGPLAENGYLASPVEVVRDGLPGVLTAAPLQELAHTTARFAIAFAITAVVGVLVGMAIGRAHTQVFSGLRDVISVVYSLPMVPFYPLFVLWLGLGTPSEVAFGVIHGVIPVTLIVMTASAEVPANYVSASRAMGATRRQRMLFVLLPALTPQIVSALKIGAALTLLGVLLAELMISINGVGSFIAAQVVSQQGAKLDAMVLVVCVGAFLVNTLLSAAEKRASRWRPVNS